MQVVHAALATLLLINLILTRVSSFWLTDTSLLLPNIIQTPQVVKSEPGVAPLATSDTGSESSWLRVEPQAALRKSPDQQQQECQCNLDWLQNQTNVWLNKWLVSNGNSRARSSLSLSNSTGASTQSNIGKRNDPTAKQPANNSNHWSSWIKATRASNNNVSRKQLKLAQGERGLEGPKGETGPRGEKGEAGASGLISVKDRDALFDLESSSLGPNPIAGADANLRPNSKQESQQTKQLQSRSLVFIEAEQMLVVGTNSGWQPIQLLSPLRDFRKAIAKFSLNSKEQRRRLLMKGRKVTDVNSIRRPIEQSDPGNAQSGANALDRSTNDVDDDELDDEEEDDEDEEEDEEEADDEDEDGDDLDLGDKKPTQVAARSALIAADSSVTGAPIRQMPVVTTAMRQQNFNLNEKPDRRLKLRIAALNEPFSGNVHGIRGADFECKRNAARAQVKGSFRAFLAAGYQNLNEVVRHSVNKYPIVNLRGETLANSWLDLFKQSSRVANPLSRIYSFDGRHVASDSNWPNKLVWHGANKAGNRDLQHNCDGWHSDSLSKFALATPLHTPRGANSSKRRHWRRFIGETGASNSTSDQSLEQKAPKGVLEIIEKYPCRMPLVVLCIETVGQHIDMTNPSMGQNSEESNNLI